MSFLINTAYATTTSAAHHASTQSFLEMLPMLIIFIAVFYFLIIRPQSKRTKEHQKLLNDLKLDDEIMTAGGILGKISRFRDQYIVIEVNENTYITLQKNSIAQVLPKGSLDNI